MTEYIDRKKIMKLLKEQKETETGAFSKGFNKGINVAMSIVKNKEILPSADVIVLPYKVGDKVAVRACCECVQTIPDSDECRYICPFEDDCECEDCDDTNERIFITTIDSIYDNGFGWKVTFNNLPIIEANITDLGTSFFVGENAEQQAKEYEKSLIEGEQNVD